MDIDELRSRLEAILALEEREPADWLAVERLAGELEREVPIDAVPEIVRHYLDDADIRARDKTYGSRQRQEVRRYLHLGEYDDGTALSWWGCALAALVGAGVIGALLL